MRRNVLRIGGGVADSIFVREFEMPSEPITGSLLIAHPCLLDPNFRRTVLFINNHSAEDGAFGMILNRPTGQAAVELLPDLEADALGEVPVFLGGPVASDRLMFAAFQWDPIEDRLTCDLHLTVEQANEMVTLGTAEVRAFVGYAGWSGGQLESELRHGGWIVRPSREDILDVERCPDLWPTVLRELGPYFRLLASAPDDPSLN